MTMTCIDGASVSLSARLALNASPGRAQGAPLLLI